MVNDNITFSETEIDRDGFCHDSVTKPNGE